MSDLIIITIILAFTFIVCLFLLKLMHGDFDNSYFPVWSDKAYWDIKDDLFGNYKTSCYYEISYSAKRKRYRLKCGGYNPKNHKYYSHVVSVLNQYIKSNTK